MEVIGDTTIVSQCPVCVCACVCSSSEERRDTKTLSKHEAIPCLVTED